MRDAIVRMTGDPDAASLVNPLVPCDLVIDHSVQVDAFASGEALTINGNLEFERNGERYRFLKWGQQAFDNFRVNHRPWALCTRVNFEHLATVVMDDGSWILSRTLVGTDSHTTMINGLGVVGWGVGGIEAEAVMLGQAVSMVLPEVIGMRLTGELPKEATATDMVLRITELLRAEGVVSSLGNSSAPIDHAIGQPGDIANTSPNTGRPWASSRLTNAPSITCEPPVVPKLCARRSRSAAKLKASGMIHRRPPSTPRSLNWISQPFSRTCWAS